MQELNLYLQFLFELIADRGPSVGLDVTLNRFDLFHGHLFLAEDSGRLGILYVHLLTIVILMLSLCMSTFALFVSCSEVGLGSTVICII